MDARNARRSKRCYGGDEPLPERIPLQAGPLSMLFEPRIAFLRYIRCGDLELIRGINAPVRDRNWGTVLPEVTDVVLETDERSFELTFVARCIRGDINFTWNGAIEGMSDGTVTFTFDGTAHSTFLRNRIGFCLLHPLECAGARCKVTHTNGVVDESAFPTTISPHQPFMDIQCIEHEVSSGLWANVRFEGDTFEMEDQRNWTDASFKTYCTPLALPFPVALKPGDRVRQKVTLSVTGTTEPSAHVVEGASEPIAIHVNPHVGRPLPELGLGWSSEEPDLGELEISRLKQLSLSHVRVPLHLDALDHLEHLKGAIAAAKSLDCGLEIALFLDQSPQERRTVLEAIADTLERDRDLIRRILIFHLQEKSTSRATVLGVKEVLASRGLSAPIAAGTRFYFTELNRERPPVDVLDEIAYSINPQVHAFDDASLVETLPAQAVTVESARTFADGRPIIVGPVTLKPSSNPNATGPEPAPAPGELPPHVDPRQSSLFAAGWTLGSLKHLCGSDAAAVTYYETVGWKGVMERAEGSRSPSLFRSIPGGVYPLYHVFADVGAMRGGELLSVHSNAPLRVEALALRDGRRMLVLAANFTGERVDVRVTFPGIAQVTRVKLLDETNANFAAADPDAYRSEQGAVVETSGDAVALTLPPFAVARIDSEVHP